MARRVNIEEVEFIINKWSRSDDAFKMAYHIIDYHVNCTEDFLKSRNKDITSTFIFKNFDKSKDRVFLASRLIDIITNSLKSDIESVAYWYNRPYSEEEATEFCFGIDMDDENLGFALIRKEGKDGNVYYEKQNCTDFVIVLEKKMTKNSQMLVPKTAYSFPEDYNPYD